MAIDDLDKYGYAVPIVLNAASRLFKLSDAICAHNGANFDKPILEANAARYGVTLPEMIWIDTSCDVDYPPNITTRKLTHLAAEHGFVNPFPHDDAVSDVLTMLKIADCYDWNTTLSFAKAPTIVVRANVTFHQKELAKKTGFRWDGENKLWLKSIKDFQLDKTTTAQQKQDL